MDPLSYSDEELFEKYRFKRLTILFIQCAADRRQLAQLQESCTGKEIRAVTYLIISAFRQRILFPVGEMLHKVMEGFRKIAAPVAFHAYLGWDRTYPVGIPWKYDTILTKTGNAYDKISGKLTAPEDGLYLFTFSTSANLNRQAAPSLVVNGNDVKVVQVCSNAPPGNKRFTCSNTAVIQLQKGQTVNIQETHTTAQPS
ncbi:uncharacterized protein LOC134268800, partial [Saccostrea cucullata]|uniref:uncharacterized protein LOC134268800 n=1 Tax=Saccostrea cuccullata TaxID=36930 RepID=UPI002ED62DC7